jgi:hypothetical protein
VSLSDDLVLELRDIAETIEALCVHEEAEREWAQLAVALMETIEDAHALARIPGLDKMLHAIEALALARLDQIEGN